MSECECVKNLHDIFFYMTTDINVGPQIGMNPKPILGLPDLETNSGSPRSDMGIFFWKNSLNTSVYIVSLLPHGHAFHHFLFTHAYKY